MRRRRRRENKALYILRGFLSGAGLALLAA